jgi:hypothetical protein
MSRAERIIQMGVQATEGLGAGSQPDVGRAVTEEVIDEIRDHYTGAHMVFVTGGMGGGTGTGAARCWLVFKEGVGFGDGQWLDLSISNRDERGTTGTGGYIAGIGRWLRESF